MRRAAILVVLAACSSPATTLAPVVEAPGGAADPYASIDELVVAVAQDGATEDLVSETFARGVHVSLPGVPYQRDLVVHLTGNSAGGEVAYGRTCAFDLVEGQPVPAPHLYFARTVKWAATAVAPATPARIGGAGLPAADGSGVFVAGLDGAGAPVTQVDHFDARTGAYDQFDGVTPRVGPAIAALGDGRIVIVGGADPTTGAAVDSIDVVDPLATPALRVTNVSDPRAARTGATAVTQADGKVAVIGGRDATGALVQTVLEIRADSGAIALREVRAALTHPREHATLTRMGDAVGAPILVVGGTDDTGQVVQVGELYKPLQESYSATVFHLQTPRTRHAAVLAPDGSVLVVGGVDGTGAPVNEIELASFDADFKNVAPLPATAGLVDFSLTTLPDGRFLLAGGRATAGGPPLASAFVLQLDPLDGTVDVAATDALPSARAGHQATLLCDGTVLLVGGTDATGAPAPPARYDPPSVGRR